MDFTKLNALINELQSRKEFEIEVELGDPVFEANYLSTIDEIKWNPKKLFDNFFKIHDGVELIYRANDEIIGETCIGELITIFNLFAQEHYIHAFDEFGEDFRQFARQFFPLDIYKESLDEVEFSVIKPVTEDELEFWIWNNSGQKYKLKFKTFEEYLEAGINCKFIVHWQHFYIDSDAMNLSDSFTKEFLASDFDAAIRRMESALDSMHKYFPDIAWAEQESTLKRIREI